MNKIIVSCQKTEISEQMINCLMLAKIIGNVVEAPNVWHFYLYMPRTVDENEKHWRLDALRVFNITPDGPISACY